MMVEDRKGTYAGADWRRIYAAQFVKIGWTEGEADREALAGWEAAEADADPYEAAEAEISYIAEG